MPTTLTALGLALLLVSSAAGQATVLPIGCETENAAKVGHVTMSTVSSSVTVPSPSIANILSNFVPPSSSSAFGAFSALSVLFPPPFTDFPSTSTTSNLALAFQTSVDFLPSSVSNPPVPPPSSNATSSSSTRPSTGAAERTLVHMMSMVRVGAVIGVGTWILSDSWAQGGSNVDAGSNGANKVMLLAQQVTEPKACNNFHQEPELQVPGPSRLVPLPRVAPNTKSCPNSWQHLLAAAHLLPIRHPVAVIPGMNLLTFMCLGLSPRALIAALLEQWARDFLSILAQSRYAVFCHMTCRLPVPPIQVRGLYPKKIFARDVQNLRTLEGTVNSLADDADIAELGPSSKCPGFVVGAIRKLCRRRTYTEVHAYPGVPRTCN
ncbi:hypothetical protein GGX14DRAFT_397727 [Mycena pura]|uniref:Uncharacterized protein n=1 Tax=Mycena pura TaxID=153505 RepID=A0AAD6V7H4_9AGAR|nr:hypothetical protein GGX14DRAFT_397727 [Mycena pura]